MGLEIEFKPIEKIVILEELQYKNKDALINTVTPMDPSLPVMIQWIDGVAFIHEGMPQTSQKVVEERTKGIVYWNVVRYAPMPEYKKEEKRGPFTYIFSKPKSEALMKVGRELKKRIR